MIPGASLLPFVPGRGKEIPEVELELRAVRIELERVAAYAKVCGFALRDHLPPTYPHVLAFPLQMAVMADGSFPFGAVGLVHVENSDTQHRRIGLDEELTIRVKPTKLEPHPRPHLLARHQGDGRPRRRSGSRPARCCAAGAARRRRRARSRLAAPTDEIRRAASERREWRLGGDLGRRYAAVSGDRNPIHMHSLTAKPLGFPRAIAHGMWTKARCLAALEWRLSDAFQVDVRFRKPILLPGKVEFASGTDGDEIEFAVRDAKRGTPHLDGHLKPLEAKSKDGRK